MRFGFVFLLLFPMTMVHGQVPEPFKKPIPASFAFELATTLANQSPVQNPNVILAPLNVPNYGNSLTKSKVNYQVADSDIKNYYLAKEQQKALIQEARETMTRAENEVNYFFPSNTREKGFEYYTDAYHELDSMLIGEIPINLLRAVHTTENAYFENTFPLEHLRNSIDQSASIISQLLHEKGYDPHNSVAKNMSIFQYLSDTISINAPYREGSITHYPMGYDFDDPWGRDNWTKQFVSKLIDSYSGQCHSLPLLYLLIAEKMGAEAYLAYAPQHSYIKFRDTFGNWVNAELTNGMFTTDNFIANSGYVKVEAISNRIYMDTLSKKQTIAHCMVDLAQGYQQKYGYDAYFLRMVETALDHHPENVFALMMRANYYTELFRHISEQHKKQPRQPLEAVPEAIAIYKNMEQAHKTLEQYGYESIPLFVYEKWLQSLQEEKHKRQHQKKFNLLKGTVTH